VACWSPQPLDEHYPSDAHGLADPLTEVLRQRRWTQAVEAEVATLPAGTPMSC
jgi:hypothetical protein